MEESTKPETRKSECDGWIAKIVCGHPHEGCEATCLRAERAGGKWGLVFKRNDTSEEFFVFYPENVHWITRSKAC